MTPQRQKSLGSKSLVALVLMSIVGVTLFAATAHAQDCLAAPNSPAREGTRWFYRLDRTTQHKCWYLRALDQPTQQVPAATKPALAARTFAIPIPRPRSSTAADTDPSSSHAGYAIPIPRPRPSATGPASSVSRDDPGRSLSYGEEIAIKASVAPPVSGSTAKSTSSIPKEVTSQQADTSSAASAPNPPPRIGAATDDATSAIPEIHQVAPSPTTNAAAAATLVRDAEALADATIDETSSPTSDMATPQQTATLNAQVVASRPNTGPTIIAPVDDESSLVSKGSATQLGASSVARSNDADPAPDVSLVEHQDPAAVATLNARLIPPDLLPHSRERTTPTDEPVDNAGMWVKPLYLIVAFLLGLVVMSYHFVFKYFIGGSVEMSEDHLDDHVSHDEYNNPEFYRKLRQGAALEKPGTPIGAAQVPEGPVQLREGIQPR
jgi:hypothetical protein